MPSAWDDVRQILREDWNPIGGYVPEDEYDNYAKVIFEIVNHLEIVSAGDVRCYLVGVALTMVDDGMDLKEVTKASDYAAQRIMELFE